MDGTHLYEQTICFGQRLTTHHLISPSLNREFGYFDLYLRVQFKAAEYPPIIVSGGPFARKGDYTVPSLELVHPHQSWLTMPLPFHGMPLKICFPAIETQE